MLCSDLSLENTHAAVKNYGIFYISKDLSLVLQEKNLDFLPQQLETHRSHPQLGKAAFPESERSNNVLSTAELMT